MDNKDSENFIAGGDNHITAYKGCMYNINANVLVHRCDRMPKQFSQHPLMTALKGRDGCLVEWNNQKNINTFGCNKDKFCTLFTSRKGPIIKNLGKKEAQYANVEVQSSGDQQSFKMTHKL